MLTPLQFEQRANQRFADNEFEKINEGSFRDFATDIRATFVAQQQANVPDWSADQSYSIGYVILHSLNGKPYFFKAKKAGYLPVPSSPLGDVNWDLAVEPVTDYSLAQRVTVAQLRGLRGNFKPGRLYILTGRQAADSTGLDDVRIRALTLTDLEPTGYLVESDDENSPTQAASYDLATDTTSQIDGGGAAYTAGQGIAISSQNEISTAVEQRTGTVLAFDTDADYAELFSGTFTLDASVRKPGIVVKALLASGCTAINLPGSTFERLGFGAFTDGLAHIYLFSTSTATGKIQYTISQRYA